MAPDLTASAQIDWRLAKLQAGDLHVQLDGNYYARQYFDAQNTQRISQSAYSLANGRVFLKSSGGHYTVGAWIKNITNREYLAYGLNQLYGIGRTGRGATHLRPGCDLSVLGTDWRTHPSPNPLRE